MDGRPKVMLSVLWSLRVSRKPKTGYRWSVFTDPRECSQTKPVSGFHTPKAESLYWSWENGGRVGELSSELDRELSMLGQTSAFPEDIALI